MKARIIHTKIWQDSFVAELNPTEKLVFIYLITNERINIVHCYECPERVIAFETGVGRDVVASTKAKLQEAGKIRCYKDWVQLLNGDRYQQFTGEKNELAKQREIKLMPDDVLSWYENKSDTPIHTPIDTPIEGVYIPSVINNQYSVISKEGGGGREATNELPTTKSPDYLLNLPEADVAEFCDKFDLSSKAVTFKAESTHDWYLGNPKRNRRENWKSTLRGFLRKDADQLRNTHGGSAVDKDDGPSEYELWVDQQMAEAQRLDVLRSKAKAEGILK